jgi:hypothetical protein
MNYEWAPSGATEDQHSDKDQRTSTHDLQARKPPTRIEQAVADARNQNQLHPNHDISHD